MHKVESITHFETCTVMQKEYLLSRLEQNVVYT